MTQAKLDGNNERAAGRVIRESNFNQIPVRIFNTNMRKQCSIFPFFFYFVCVIEPNQGTVVSYCGKPDEEIG